MIEKCPCKGYAHLMNSHIQYHIIYSLRGESRNAHASEGVVCAFYQLEMNVNTFLRQKQCRKPKSFQSLSSSLCLKSRVESHLNRHEQMDLLRFPDAYANHNSDLSHRTVTRMMAFISLNTHFFFTQVTCHVTTGK